MTQQNPTDIFIDVCAVLGVEHGLPLPDGLLKYSEGDWEIELSKGNQNPGTPNTFLAVMHKGMPCIVGHPFEIHFYMDSQADFLAWLERQPRVELETA